MIDPKLLAENPALIQENLASRKRLDLLACLEEAKELYGKQREARIKVEQKREMRNQLAELIATLPKEQRVGKMGEGKKIREELVRLDKNLHEMSEQLNKILRELPNLTLEMVPKGGEEANREIEKWGEIPKFAFEVKDHIELGKGLGLLDIERAAKVSGSRFVYLTGDGVLLELALVNLAMKTLLKEGFIPVVPPTLIRVRTTQDLGYWHSSNHLNYYLVADYEDIEQGQGKENPLYLVGTAEHALVPMHSDEVFETKDLPRRYVGYSSCYRREAGSYGKDIRGILRVHQFEKVEMVSFCTPDQAEIEHARLVELATGLMQDLGLPYRLVELAAGDISFPAARTVDIETWIPSQQTYRETHSISTTTDYQSRRFNTRFKTEHGTQFVHILNGTAFAIGRILIAILENFQQADGSVKVPSVLQAYIGKDSLVP